MLLIDIVMYGSCCWYCCGHRVLIRIVMVDVVNNDVPWRGDRIGRCFCWHLVRMSVEALIWSIECLKGHGRWQSWPPWRRRSSRRRLLRPRPWSFGPRWWWSPSTRTRWTEPRRPCWKWFNVAVTLQVNCFDINGFRCSTEGFSTTRQDKNNERQPHQCKRLDSNTSYYSWMTNDGDLMLARWRARE